MYVSMYKCMCMYVLQLQCSQLVHLFLLQAFDSLLEIFLHGNYCSRDHSKKIITRMYVCICMYVSMYGREIVTKRTSLRIQLFELGSFDVQLGGVALMDLANLVL